MQRMNEGYIETYTRELCVKRRLDIPNGNLLHRLLTEGESHREAFGNFWGALRGFYGNANRHDSCGLNLFNSQANVGKHIRTYVISSNFGILAGK